MTRRVKHGEPDPADDTSGSDPTSAPDPEVLRPSEIDTTEAEAGSVVQHGAEPASESAPSGAVVMVASFATASPPAVGVTDEPVDPVEPPTMWTLAAFARREFASGAANRSPTVNPLAGQITNGLATETATLTRNIGASTLGPSATAQPTQTWPPATFTGEPSILSQALSAVFGVISAISSALHVDITIPVTALLTSSRPPWLTTLGLNVQRSEFEGMPVWALQSPHPAGKTVVAVHGGADVLRPTIFNWLAYAAIARDTGASVIVPIYRLAQYGGAAGTVVSAVADLITTQIDQHGADNVSVHGDSAGGAIALAAVQELVRRGDPVPSHMVLSSPGLDSTLSNPAIPLTHDPVLSGSLAHLHSIARRWAGGLDLTDPLVSPLYGSLAGLPPTAVYAGSRDAVAPDVLLLQDKAMATAGADFTFILRKGEPHDWAIITILPETQAVLPDIYRQLGLASDAMQTRGPGRRNRVDGVLSSI